MWGRVRGNCKKVVPLQPKRFIHHNYGRFTEPEVGGLPHYRHAEAEASYCRTHSTQFEDTESASNGAGYQSCQEAGRVHIYQAPM